MTPEQHDTVIATSIAAMRALVGPEGARGTDSNLVNDTLTAHGDYIAMQTVGVLLGVLAGVLVECAELRGVTPEELIDEFETNRPVSAPTPAPRI